MTFLAMLVETLERSQQRFEEVLDKVSLEEANAFPLAEQVNTLKSISWLTWHTARELDLQISDLVGHQALWLENGWSQKFALDLADDTEDWRHSPEDAAKVTVADLSLLRAYLAEALALAKSYLTSLDESDLDEVIDRSWSPAVTRGARLVSIIDDAVMHSGQAVYAYRLLAFKD